MLHQPIMISIYKVVSLVMNVQILMKSFPTNVILLFVFLFFFNSQYQQLKENYNLHSGSLKEPFASLQIILLTYVFRHNVIIHFSCAFILSSIYFVQLKPQCSNFNFSVKFISVICFIVVIFITVYKLIYFMYSADLNFLFNILELYQLDYFYYFFSVK